MSLKVDFFAREPHHIEHSRAIYDKLPQEVQGLFLTSDEELASSENRIVAVFSYGDLKRVSESGKKAIFGDHGIGMFYNTNHPSYAGSLVNRECVILRLSPNETHAKKERKILKCPVRTIGVPKMDKWHSLRNKNVRRKRRPIVAISFHWDCRVCPETRSLYPYYRNILRSLAQRYEVWGHGHPRIFPSLVSTYKTYGIRAMADFDRVMKEADIYICDNSSTIFEFAYTKKPVILLNAPLYRKDVEHEGNPRFWKYANMGYQVDRPDQIFGAIEDTINYPIVERSEQAVKEVFHYLDGKCGDRAAKIISNFIKTYED